MPEDLRRGRHWAGVTGYRPYVRGHRGENYCTVHVGSLGPYPYMFFNILAAYEKNYPTAVVVFINTISISRAFCLRAGRVPSASSDSLITVFQGCTSTKDIQWKGQAQFYLLPLRVLTGCMYGSLEGEDSFRPCVSNSPSLVKQRGVLIDGQGEEGNPWLLSEEYLLFMSIHIITPFGWRHVYTVWRRCMDNGSKLGIDRCFVCGRSHEKP